MKDTIIIKNANIKLNNPILIVGLPGIGNVGKIVAAHLKKEFAAKRIATLYSPHLPNQVLMTKKGTIRLMSNKFYLIKPKNSKNDIIILTGDFQPMSPEGQYDINERIAEFFVNELGGKFIYTVGGYVSNTGDIKKPRVFGNVTNISLIKELKEKGVVFGESKGFIWGAAGMIPVFGKKYGIPGACLMGEAFVDYDASAAKSVINVLSEVLNLKIKTDELDVIIKKVAEKINKMEGKMNNTMPLPPESDHGMSYIR